MARKRTGKKISKWGILQRGVGHFTATNLVKTGLEEPPSIPLNNPYNFRLPRIVNTTPTHNGGNQSINKYIQLPLWLIISPTYYSFNGYRQTDDIDSMEIVCEIKKIRWKRKTGILLETSSLHPQRPVPKTSKFKHQHDSHLGYNPS
jgi:hypothetical protein